MPALRPRNGGDLAWAVINYGEGTSPSPVTIYADDAGIRAAARRGRRR